MSGYILRRLLWAIPVLLGASFLVFWSIRWVPGGPAIAIAGELATPALIEQINRDLGLDQPLLVQYGIFLGRAVQGELGRSVRSGLPVTQEISTRLPRTVQLAFLSLLVAAAIGIPIGVLSATRANSWVDAASMAAGIALVTWFKGEARRVYAMLGESDEDRDQRRLVEWIERKGGSVTARAVQQGCRWLKETGMAEAALNDLVRAGEGDWHDGAPGPKGGRPSSVFKLSTPSTSTKPLETRGIKGFVDVDTVDAPENANRVTI